MEGTVVTAPIIVFPLQIITNEKKIFFVALGLVFPLCNHKRAIYLKASLTSCTQ